MLVTRPYRVTWALELDDAPSSAARVEYTLNLLLYCLFAIDASYLASHPNAPLFAASGVRYMPEAPGQEDWQDIPTTIENRFGDAKDLAAWLCAEKWIRAGQPVIPEFQRVRMASGSYGFRVGMRDQATGHWQPLPGDPVLGSKMRRVTFGLDLFRGAEERELSRQALRLMLDCLYKIDLAYLATHPNTPPIYRSGVRYMEEPLGQEDWQDVATSIRMGVADCEDCACWRAAERTLRQGLPSKPVYIEQPRDDGSMLYHIVVADARTGQVVEDPSRVLGMR